MSSRTTVIAAVSRPCTATFAPCRANSRAMAAPIPRELPVTRATLSFRSSLWFTVASRSNFLATLIF
jgi:hypothetical protein